MSDTVDPRIPLPAPSSAGLRWLFGSTAAAVTGQGAIAAAAPLYATTLTSSPFLVALVAAAAWLPWIAIGILTGALVDRWDPRTVMVITDLTRAVLMGGFTILILSGAGSIWLLMTVVLLAGIGSCFFDPASQSEIPKLVGRDPHQLARANGTFWSIDTFARVLVGAVLGAWLFSRAPALPFAAQSLLFVASGLMLVALPRRTTPTASTASATDDQHLTSRTTGEGLGLLRQVRTGLVCLWTTDILRQNALCMGLYNLAYNTAFATLVLVLKRNLEIADVSYGILLACMALGGAVGGFAARHRRWTPLNAYGLGFLVQAAGWVVILIAPQAWVAGIAFAAIGAFSTLVSAIGGAASQHATPETMIGRVSAATRLVGIGAAAIGALLSGVIATLGGLNAPVLVAGVLLLASATWVLTPRRTQPQT